jgi:acyl-CoA thioester hydrolase
VKPLSIATEQVVSREPVVVRRRVRWGECDPAGVVYTSRFSDYVISAAELFYGSLVYSTPQCAKREQGFGTPTRALSFEFSRSLYPDDEFDMTVLVKDIRVRTYVLNVAARTADSDLIFEADLTAVCVGRNERKSIEIPATFRAVLELYRQAFTA